MKYWIASYPRSGNTFLRILFKEVYGIYTWEGYGDENPKTVLDQREQRQSKEEVFIKTHELPEKTLIPHNKLKSIYLVRDGRDAVVSMAYHRCNIVKPGSDYEFNLTTTVLAPFGTSFGGWSKHVEQWSKVADIIIKFEDLISDPLSELKKLEEIMELPQGDYSKIPTFRDLKTKKFSLGSGNNDLSEEQQKKQREKFFRSGKTNEWKSKIPHSLQMVFNHKHGHMLSKMGYDNIVKDQFVIFKILKNYILWIVGFIKEKIK